jgi:hypothetical protein
MAAKKDNTIVIVIGSSLVAMGLYKLITGAKGAGKDPGGTNSGDTTTAPAIPPTIKATAKALDYNKLLSKGVKGDEVVKLQSIIGTAMDGDFGSNTENALYAKTGLRSGSLNQIIKIIQEKSTQSAAQTQKNKVILEYPVNKFVIAAVDVKPPLYENRGGIWLKTDSYGNSLGSVSIKTGMDLGTIRGYYNYEQPPWLIVELNTKVFGSWYGSKRVILKGNWLKVTK